jgi:hypothetical protein
MLHINRSSLRQIVRGLGFEIQLDSIESGNNGLPATYSSVPHDLVEPERSRLAREMLRGFRYCRLAGGLYWRGLDPEQKNLRPRWMSQLTELRSLLDEAAVEGLSFEYWSPAPFWKANRKFTGLDGSECVLRCFGENFLKDPIYRGDTDRFLRDFAEACCQDLQTLREAGLTVRMWGLQNEPYIISKYSSCAYSPEQYARAFLAVAPKIRGFDPSIEIIADTWDLRCIAPVLAQPFNAHLVDALVIHHVGSDSNVIRSGGEMGVIPGFHEKPRFQNEFEYLEGPASPARCLNTVQHIMNWFQVGGAPTWFWIHALKPFTNREASGYSLGFWRPPGAENPKLPFELPEGHWTWNRLNWNAVGSFLRRMPWNSQVVELIGDTADPDLRSLAYLKPDGKLTIALSNRSGKSHTVEVDDGLSSGTFVGWVHTPTDTNELGRMCGTRASGRWETRIEDLSWQFWEEQ